MGLASLRFSSGKRRSTLNNPPINSATLFETSRAGRGIVEFTTSSIRGVTVSPEFPGVELELRTGRREGGGQFCNRSFLIASPTVQIEPRPESADGHLHDVVGASNSILSPDPGHIRTTRHDGEPEGTSGTGCICFGKHLSMKRTR